MQNINKKQSRKLIRERLYTLGPQNVRTYSLSACKKILASDEYLNAKTVMIFLPIAGEIDPRLIALDAWQRGKRVCVPKVVSKGLMNAIEINSLEEGLETSSMGITEPISNIPIQADNIDFIVVPGLGFDRNGNRLGRGGGFYDRFLVEAENTGTLFYGIAFGIQVLDKIETQPHDKKIHILATEKELLRFKK